MASKIPHPPRKPLTGNLHQLSGKPPMQTMLSLANEYGPIYELKLLHKKLIVVSGPDLVDELCDEKRFRKIVAGPVEKLRVLAGDGLFTAHNDEPNWKKAHNILLPGMSMQAMKGYFPIMLDVAVKLLGKWDQAATAQTELDVSEDMSRLTFDTIGLCGFDYDFRSFESNKLHPFVDHMNYCLEETLRKFYKLPLTTMFEFSRRKKFAEGIAMMNDTVDQVIHERIRTQSVKNDFLSLMLNGVDKITGEKLDNENIRYQVLTFLIAGHETTSGLITFALNFLVNNPEVLQKAYDEADRVLGNDLSVMPEYRNISEMKYISQILKESLRLWAPIAGFRLTANEDTLLGGKYNITKGQMLFTMLPALHRDKQVWGDNADEFDPEHFSEEAESKRSNNTFKPFGNGMRACIGRQFAMVEATLIMGMILQRYKLINHKNYKLKIKELITIKPDEFTLKLEKRTSTDRRFSKAATVTARDTGAHVSVSESTNTAHNTPLLVLFGSNMGTSEEIANQLCNEGIQLGYKAQVGSLDDHETALPGKGAVIIVCSTYNGNPPDNAVEFMKHLFEATGVETYKGVKYTVMGCGNSEWKTFQAVPRAIDAGLAKLGAKRIHTTGEANANADFENEYEQWHTSLWKDLASEFGIDGAPESASKTADLLSVEFFGNGQLPSAQPTPKQTMKVLKNDELQNFEVSRRSTRHIEVALPAGIHYQPGDHLGVMPINSDDLVMRVAKRFNLDLAATLQITKTGAGNTHYPVDQKIMLKDLLQNYVELQEVATRKQLQAITERTICPPEKMKLQKLLSDDENGYVKYVLGAKRSVLDLLEEFAACEITFAAFLELLPPLRHRYYSISSSQKNNADVCSISVSVLDAPARSGQGIYKGVCSNHLAAVAPGDLISCYIKPPVSTFRLPTHSGTPVIMIGPGTGFAPFRGFLQERQWLKDQGTSLGKAMLFYGCRHPEQDFIYKEELGEFGQNGIATMITAFSRHDENAKEYVQHKLYQHKDDVWQMMQDGGKIFICGDGGKMEPDVRNTLDLIYNEKANDNTESWVDRLRAEQRYLTDVWVSF